MKHKYKWGQCLDCPPNQIRLLVVKRYCKEHNEKRKREAKSKRVVRLVNRAEKKKGVKQLKKDLIEVFHRFIRERDKEGDCFTCISCSKIFSARNIQAGHFIPGTYEAIRFDERNVNGQCGNCNGFTEGNFEGYEKGMLKKYGQKTIDILKYTKHNKVKWSRFEYEILIQEYTNKLKLLNRE